MIVLTSALVTESVLVIWEEIENSAVRTFTYGYNYSGVLEAFFEAVGLSKLRLVSAEKHAVITAGTSRLHPDRLGQVDGPHDVLSIQQSEMFEVKASRVAAPFVVHVQHDGDGCILGKGEIQDSFGGMHTP